MIKSIFLLCLILCNLNFGFSLQCSKVGDLPSDLKQMLPDYDKLNKFHLNRELSETIFPRRFMIKF